MQTSTQKFLSQHKFSINTQKFERVSFHKNFKTLTTTTNGFRVSCFSLAFVTKSGGKVWLLQGYIQQQRADKVRISQMSMPSITILLKQAVSRQIPTYPVASILLNSASMRKQATLLAFWHAEQGSGVIQGQFSHPSRINHFAIKSNIIILTSVERSRCEASTNHVFSPGKVTLTTT